MSLAKGISNADQEDSWRIHWEGGIDLDFEVWPGFSLVEGSAEQIPEMGKYPFQFLSMCSSS